MDKKTMWTEHTDVNGNIVQIALLTINHTTSKFNGILIFVRI